MAKTVTRKLRTASSVKKQAKAAPKAAPPPAPALPKKHRIAAFVDALGDTGGSDPTVALAAKLYRFIVDCDPEYGRTRIAMEVESVLDEASNR